MSSSNLENLVLANITKFKFISTAEMAARTNRKENDLQEAVNALIKKRVIIENGNYPKRWSLRKTKEAKRQEEEQYYKDYSEEDLVEEIETSVALPETTVIH